VREQSRKRERKEEEKERDKIDRENKEEMVRCTSIFK
jgi:hypothetical protein